MIPSTPYLIPESPPAEVLAELDEAARVLDGLRARAAALTLDMDPQARGLRIKLSEDGDVRRLRPRDLLDLLAGA
ncbi:MAG: hypothetical protein M3R12_11560 [Actinomycetota bacterium]|nr:hypothetical protein [Actinomycetota bacterium]